MLRKRLAIFTLALLLLLVGCGGPFAGGQLEGTNAAIPDDWSEVAKTEVVRLETNPTKPYSVNLWVIGMDSFLYVHAGATRSSWVEHIEEDSSVRLLVGDAIFELDAVRVEDPDEFKAFSDVYKIKYGNPPRNENVAEAYLFRLAPRGAL